MPIFLVELVGFTFLRRTRLSLCAEILIMFHCSILDQKVNGRSLGSFTGAPPTPQAGSRLVCGLIAHQFPILPDLILLLLLFGMTRFRSAFTDPLCFL
jgi:hypothetical protein